MSIITKYDTNFNQLLFADHSGDFPASGGPTTAANSYLVSALTETDVQIDLTGLAASGGGRHSAKTADLGTQRPGLYLVEACIEFETAPTDGKRVDFFWAASPNATAGNANPGGVTGSDANYTETMGTLSQLQRIGALTVRNNVINLGLVGMFTPLHRYGSLIVINQANTAFRSTATAMDETHIVMTPIARALYA